MQTFQVTVNVACTYVCASYMHSHHCVDISEKDLECADVYLHIFLGVGHEKANLTVAQGR